MGTVVAVVTVVEMLRWPRRRRFDCHCCCCRCRWTHLQQLEDCLSLPTGWLHQQRCKCLALVAPAATRSGGRSAVCHRVNILSPVGLLLYTSSSRSFWRGLRGARRAMTQVRKSSSQQSPGSMQYYFSCWMRNRTSEVLRDRTRAAPDKRQRPPSRLKPRNLTGIHASSLYMGDFVAP